MTKRIFLIAIIIIMMMTLTTACGEDSNSCCLNDRFFVCDNATWASQCCTLGICAGCYRDPSKEPCN